jgi:hypothetical protein
MEVTRDGPLTINASSIGVVMAMAVALLDIEPAEKDPGVSPSTGVTSRAPGGAELGLELRRETGVAHHGRFVNFN